MIPKPPNINNGHARKGAIANESVSICWNSHLSILRHMLYQLFSDQRLVDVTLTCEGGGKVRCHRVVLAACSNYFESVLSNDSSDNMTIFLSGMQPWELDALIIFMYTGEVKLINDQLASFIQKGISLEIEGLLNVDPINPIKVKQRPPPAPRPQRPLQSSAPAKNRMPPIVEETLGGRKLMPKGNKNVVAANRTGSPPVPLNLMLDKIKQKLPEPGIDEDEIVATTFLENNLPNPEYAGPGNGGMDLSLVKTELMDVDEDHFQQQEELQQLNANDGEGANEIQAQQLEKESGIESQVTEPAVESQGKDVGSDAPEDDGANDSCDMEKGNESAEAETELSRFYSPSSSVNSRRMKYLPELKVNAVYDLINGMGLADCAEKYNVPKKTLSNWKSKHLKRASAPKRPSSVDTKKKATPVKNTPKAVQVTPNPPVTSGPHPTSALPVVEGTTREEHLKNAAKLVVDKMTNVRGAAHHYGIPRTTLSNYMRRNGLIWLRKGNLESPQKPSDNDEMPNLPSPIADEDRVMNVSHDLSEDSDMENEMEEDDNHEDERINDQGEESHRIANNENSDLMGEGVAQDVPGIDLESESLAVFFGTGDYN